MQPTEAGDVGHARAKAKIKAARIPYRVPSAADLPARVSGVLAVLFLVFNEGYLATGPTPNDKAIELAGNTAETAHLTRRRDQLGQRPSGATYTHRSPLPEPRTRPS